MSVTIAPLQAADRERWAELWTAYLAFYDTELPPAIVTSTWSRILDPHGDIRGLGARDADGELQGIAHFFYHPHAWSTRDACYLQDLFVAPAARKRGMARALIETVAHAAREHGSHKLYWQTSAANATARRLYDTLAAYEGFIVYERPIA